MCVCCGQVSLQSNELLQLNVDELIELTASDDLNVKNEEIVFDTIVRWIDHDPEMRKDDIVPLLKSIRLGLLSTQFFVEKVKVRKHGEQIGEQKEIVPWVL